MDNSLGYVFSEDEKKQKTSPKKNKAMLCVLSEKCFHLSLPFATTKPTPHQKKRTCPLKSDHFKKESL